MKLSIEKSTLVGIANAIRRKKGTSADIPVPNLENEIDSIPTGGGKSYLLREDNIVVTAAPTLIQDATGNKSVLVDSSNFSATDSEGNAYELKAPKGANYCTIECTYTPRNVARDFIGGKAFSRDMFEKLANLYAIATDSGKTAWSLRVHQACGAFYSNGSVFNIFGSTIVASTSEWESMFGTSEKIDAIFGAFNASTILSCNSTQSGGLYINDEGHLVYIFPKRSSGSTNYACFKTGSEYKIRWFYFDKPPVTGFFQEPYDE